MALGVTIVAAILGVILRGAIGGIHDETDIGAVAIVTGTHANAPTPTLTTSVRNSVLKALEGGGEVSLVTNSGRPEVISPVSYNPPCHNLESCQLEVNRIDAAVRDTPAAYPENNLLVAIELAARTIRSHSGPKTLVIIDSGLQTVAPLEFHQELPLLDVNPEDIADHLAYESQLPNLTQITVIFSGLGDTAEPQLPLNLAQRSALREAWEAICRKAGGQPVFDESPLSGPTPEGLPVVATVPPPAPVSLEGVGLNTSVALPISALAFDPDSAVISDPARASELLRPLAKEALDLRATVRVIGTTASAGSLETQHALSLARARAVADQLVSLGVPPNQIIIKGPGSTGPGVVPDRDSNGQLLPGPAAQNRKVILELPPAR